MSTEVYKLRAEVKRLKQEAAAKPAFSTEVRKVLAKIALADHDPKCPHKFCPVNECECYRPDVWASRLLGVEPPVSREARDEKRLKEILEGK